MTNNVPFLVKGWRGQWTVDFFQLINTWLPQSSPLFLFFLLFLIKMIWCQRLGVYSQFHCRLLFNGISQLNERFSLINSVKCFAFVYILQCCCRFGGGPLKIEIIKQKNGTENQLFDVQDGRRNTRRDDEAMTSSCRHFIVINDVLLNQFQGQIHVSGLCVCVSGISIRAIWNEDDGLALAYVRSKVVSRRQQ